MSKTTTTPATAIALPEDFQDRVFRAIAVQRPAVTSLIKEVRRKDPSASPADVMKKIESQYLATITTASVAAGASSTIPAVGVGIAIGLGVADLLFFYETTALFALAHAELRGIPTDDPERAKAVVLGALLGEKRNSPVTAIVLSALPGGGALTNARERAVETAGGSGGKWGELLAQQLPDSALVPVAMVLAREVFVKEGAKSAVKIGSKAIPLPLVGAVAGGATSLFFGNSVVKACREGFSAPADTWPKWLELTYSDGSNEPDPSRAVLAMRAAADSAKDFGETTWSKLYDATEVFRAVDLDGDGVADEARALTALKGASGTVTTAASGAAKSVGAAASGAAKSAGALAAGAAGSVTGVFKRGKRDAETTDAAGSQDVTE